MYQGNLCVKGIPLTLFRKYSIMGVVMLRPNADYISQETGQFLFSALLKDKIRLSDIPFELRIHFCSCYIAAFRIGYMSYERYCEELKILCDDILALDDKKKLFYKCDLISILGTYSVVDFTDFRKKVTEEEIEKFRKMLPEELLSDLQRDSRATQKLIEADLKKRGIIP
jgi:hypothetical protein